MHSIPTQQHPSSRTVESGVTVTAERGNEPLHSAETTARGDSPWKRIINIQFNVRFFCNLKVELLCPPKSSVLVGEKHAQQVRGFCPMSLHPIKVRSLILVFLKSNLITIHVEKKPLMQFLPSKTNYMMGVESLTQLLPVRFELLPKYDALSAFFLLAAAWVSPGRSALQSAKHGRYRRHGHKHKMMSYIIQALSKTCNKAKNQKTIRILSVGKSQEARPCVQDEGFGEIPKESTYARVGRNTSRHKCKRRGLW